MPERIQLRRTKGWKMPENTVKVDRTTRFGNRFLIDDMGRYDAVAAFRSYAGGELWDDEYVRADQLRLREDIKALRGKNLGCWCRPDQVCHADVLLELANAPPIPDPAEGRDR